MQRALSAVRTSAKASSWLEIVCRCRPASYPSPNSTHSSNATKVYGNRPRRRRISFRAVSRCDLTCQKLQQVLEAVSLVPYQFGRILGNPGLQRPEPVEGPVLRNAKTPQSLDFPFRGVWRGPGYGDEPVSSNLGHGIARAVAGPARAFHFRSMLRWANPATRRLVHSSPAGGNERSTRSALLQGVKWQADCEDAPASRHVFDGEGAAIGFDTLPRN